MFLVKLTKIKGFKACNFAVSFIKNIKQLDDE